MYDVIVVGGGNAACAAAVSARENGAKRVVLLEKAPKEQRGGNTHFSGAILRFVFNEVEQLDRFVPTAEKEYPGFHEVFPSIRRKLPRRPDARHARHERSGARGPADRCLVRHDVLDAGRGQA